MARGTGLATEELFVAVLALERVEDRVARRGEPTVSRRLRIASQRFHCSLAHLGLTTLRFGTRTNSTMSLVVPEAHVQFQHILRLLNTNVDGKRKIMVSAKPCISAFR